MSTNLSWWVKEFVDAYFDLVKQYWVYGAVEFMSDKLFDMFLYLRSKLLVITYEKLQQVTDKSKREKGKVISSDFLSSTITLPFLTER